MILFHPPIAKPCEPPAGLAKLAGALKYHGIQCAVVDSNLEGIIDMLSSPASLPENRADTWSIRAHNHKIENLESFGNQLLYQNMDRYKRTVMDINRVLQIAGHPFNTSLSLSNYKSADLTPVNSSHLLKAAERPDQNPFYKYFKRRLLQLLETKQPRIAGFSINYLSQAISAFAMIGFLKQVYPNLKIIIGGGLVTSWMRRPDWKNPFKGLVDHTIDGPGEKPLLSLVGVEQSLIHYTPDYGPFMQYKYMAPDFILPYKASNGCYWNKCSFCPEQTEKTVYRPIPVTQVIQDLHLLIKETNPHIVHFLDNAVSPVLLKAITDKPLNTPWYCFARLTRHFTDLQFCKKLKKSGCIMLKLGLESGDQDVLDKMNKGIDLKLASIALKTLKQAGIATYVYLLFGTLQETQDKAQKTMDYTIKHIKYIDFLNIAVFNMPAYGPEAQQIKTHDFYAGDLALYKNFTHPKGWNRNLVRHFLDKKFKKHPAIASVIQKDPLFFTSNHAPFFTKTQT